MPSRLKIYVIDDSLELRDWLLQAGHQVLCSSAGLLQLHAVLEYKPNLIVLDLPHRANQGLEIYQKLCNHRQLCQVPMIVVSDDASLEYEMLEVFDFQARPFDHERLNICLKRLSGSRKYQPGVSFAESELAALKQYLLEHSGLHFSQHNHRILERGLMRRIQALRMASLSAYAQYLAATPDNYDEVSKLIGLLTVGETSFFRYRSHRDALVHFAMPRLLEANRSQARLRIWSAGCSTGEEPYSLAILLLEHFPELAEWDVQILATDINKRSLRKAREGVYGERSLRMMESPLRERYFQKKGDHYLISAQVKRMVRFDYLNLQEDSFIAEKMEVQGVDLLFCRNVLIYFELETIRSIVAKFSRILSPHGYLFLGHAETMQSVSDQFQRHHQNNAFFYQRKEPVAVMNTVKGAATVVHERAEPAARRRAGKADKVTATVAQGEKTLPAQPRQSDLADPKQLYRDAMAAFDHERFADSAKLFEAILEQQPGNAGALVGKGLLLANQGEYREARIYCARAIKADDLLPEAYLLRGLILDMEGFVERALVEYQKVLWLEPASVMAHYFSAKAYGQLSEPTKELRALMNTLRTLERSADQAIIPFSGGLSRSVFLAVVHRELAAVSTR